MSNLNPLILVLLITLFMSGCNHADDSKDSSNASKKTETKDSSTEKHETCEITCPHCGYKKTETLPTEYCQIKYQCENCSKILTPEGDDCCVFCSHSTHKCPSKQIE